MTPLLIAAFIFSAIGFVCICVTKSRRWWVIVLLILLGLAMLAVGFKALSIRPESGNVQWIPIQ